MRIDLSKSIATLLYVRDSIIIPDLGGIVASDQSASVDHVQGKIIPPSKKLTFNENLVINDGVLEDYLQKEYKITHDEAAKALADYVVLIQGKLDRKEIFFFPNVGRLYKDYEGNMKFLPDNTNFSTSAFGLPVVKSYPVLRTKEQAFQIKSKPYLRTPEKREPVFDPAVIRKAAVIGLPVLFIAFLLSSGYFLYQFQKNKQLAEEMNARKIPVETRINQKPSVETFSIIDGAETASKADNDRKETEENDSEAPLGIEPVTPPAGQKEGIIIIGAYSKKVGVERRIREVYELGYDAYQDKRGALTRVGVRFLYSKNIELKNMLDTMREEFDHRAWILTE